MKPFFKLTFKVMLHQTIRNNDFRRNTALQYCCDIVLNSHNIVPTLQRCVALKTSLRIEPCNITFSRVLLKKIWLVLSLSSKTVPANPHLECDRGLGRDSYLVKQTQMTL